MNSAFLKLTSSDVAKSAVNALFAAFIFACAGLLGQEGGFDLFTADWAAVLKLTVNGAFAAFVGDAGRRFTTTSEGNFMGVVKL